MNEAKHTPGPWTCRETAGAGLQIYGNVSAALGKDFAEVVQIFDTFENPPRFMIAYERWVQFPRREWKEMQAANARLIAAAPVMFQTLRDMDGWLDNSGFTDEHPWRISIRAAIAAATGSEQ
jgi:hypothetical protein